MFDGFESFEHREKSAVTPYFWDGYVAGSSTQKLDVPLIYREDFKFGASFNMDTGKMMKEPLK